MFVYTCTFFMFSKDKKIFLFAETKVIKYLMQTYKVLLD